LQKNIKLKSNINSINLPLFVFTNRQKEEIKQDNCVDYIKIKAVTAERKKN